MKAQRVEDVMVRNIAVVRASEDVRELEKKLLGQRVHGMPVVDDAGALAGVVSQTDLLAWHYGFGVGGATFYGAGDTLDDEARGLAGLRSARVDEIMSPVVHCICPDQSLALAAARMIERGVHRLVVIDEAGKVLGLVTAADLLKTLPGVEEAQRKLASETDLARQAVRAGRKR